MKGTYVFKQNGVEIGRAQNLITTAGEYQIAKSITLQNSQWAASIAIGSGALAADPADKKLQFEFGRGDINSISYADVVYDDTTSHIRLFAKATLGENISGVIYEAGIFSSTIDIDEFQRPLFNCEPSEGWDYQNTDSSWAELSEKTSPYGYISGGYAGDQFIDFALFGAPGGVGQPTTTRKIRFFNTFDFSEVSSSDDFVFALKKSATGTCAMTVKFYTDESNYFTLPTQTPTNNTSYQFIKVSKSLATQTGTLADWANINFIEVYNPDGLIQLDSARINRSVQSTQNILVSRTVLSSPVTKVEGVPLEIEYYLDLF